MGNCIGCGRFAPLDPHTDECRWCRLGEFEGCPDCGQSPCRCYWPGY